MLSATWILAYYLFTIKNRSSNSWPSKQWILGHRGTRSKAPENTLSAFRLAIKQGADGIEFDVCLSKDGVPMVIHDHTVNRTTFSSGRVKDMTAKELQNLNATKAIPGFKPEGVPTLKETLACLPEGAIANVELKFSGNFSKEYFLHQAMKDIRAHESRLKIIVSSFDGELLAMLREQEPKLLLSLILSSKDKHWPSSLKYLTKIEPDGLHLSPHLLNLLIYRLIQRARLKVGVWTINDPKMAQRLLSMGVDGIFTDDVERIIQSIKAKEHFNK